MIVKILKSIGRGLKSLFCCCFPSESSHQYTRMKPEKKSLYSPDMQKRLDKALGRNGYQKRAEMKKKFDARSVNYTVQSSSGFLDHAQAVHAKHEKKSQRWNFGLWGKNNQGAPATQANTGHRSMTLHLNFGRGSPSIN